MSNCNACTKVNALNKCANTIFIPDVSGTADGDYNVILTDLSTGRVENIPVTADANTLLVPVSEELMTGHTYQIDVYEGGDYNEKRNITIGVTEACCVTFEVKDFGDPGTYEILSLDGCE